MMFLFLIRKLLGFLFLFMGALALYAQPAFVEVQSIPTVGANSCKTFLIDNELYLAVANFNNGNSNSVNSNIYKWKSNSFELFQTIPTVGASEFEYVEYGGKKMLILACYADNNNYSIQSKVFTWKNNQFEESQSINTIGAYRVKAFEIDNQLYMFMAFQCTSPFCVLNSILYRYDGVGFDSVQAIPTSGASGLDFFSVKGSFFLAIANTYSTSSTILEWKDNKFVTKQSVSSLGATSVRHFNILDIDYLAIANGRSFFSFTTNSPVLKLENQSFTAFQNLQTTGAFYWEEFKIEGTQYLAVANYKDENSNFNLSSEIFRWENGKFVTFQKIPTQGATSFQYAEIGSKKLLIVSNYKNSSTHLVDSKVYEYLTNPLVLQSYNKQPIEVFYNPNSEWVEIEGDLNQSISSIDLFDMNGRLLKTSNYSNRLSTDNIQAGIYIVEIKTDNGIFRRKIHIDI
jgi:hypothetical protein